MLSGYEYHICAKLCELRKRLRLTQEEMAATLDIHQTAVSRIESGQQMVTIDQLIRVAIRYRVYDFGVVRLDKKRL